MTKEQRFERDKHIFDSPQKWRNWRINISFLRELHNAFRTRLFTNKQAYQLYIVKRAIPYFYRNRERFFKVGWYPMFPTSRGAQYFLRMNVRNTLCAAAYHGKICRVRPGVYKFWSSPRKPCRK